MVVLLLLCCAAFVLAKLEDPDIMNNNEQQQESSLDGNLSANSENRSRMFIFAKFKIVKSDAESNKITSTEIDIVLPLRRCEHA